jgi:chemotaxis protein MotB
MRLLIGVLCVGTGIVQWSCVSNSTHEQLQNQFHKSQAEKNQLSSAIKDLEAQKSKWAQEKDSLTKQVIELQKQIQSLKGFENQVGTLSQEKSQLEGNLARLAKLQEESAKRIAEFKSITEKFKALVDSGKLLVKLKDGKMYLEMATDILFASGSAKLSEAGKASIEEVSKLLQSIDQKSFQVEGHTDNQPIKTSIFPSNWELAAARSISVVKTMVDAGLAPTRISAASYGENFPKSPNDSKEGKASNRRIEIVMVPDLSILPGNDEISKLSSEKQVE